MYKSKQYNFLLTYSELKYWGASAEYWMIQTTGPRSFTNQTQFIDQIRDKILDSTPITLVTWPDKGILEIENYLTATQCIYIGMLDGYILQLASISVPYRHRFVLFGNVIGLDQR